MILNCIHFRFGEVYLFHRSSRRCEPRTALWGLFDKRSGDDILLECSSADLIHFDTWKRLPSGYRYCRKASRAELRDFTAGMIVAEMDRFKKDKPVLN